MAEALHSRHQLDLASKDFTEAKRDLALELDRAAINDEQRTVEFSFASETPVDRWFGREILDVTKEGCDLTRLNGGGACLMDHDWRDQVGVVTKAWVDPTTKKARCEVKFSRSTRGKEVFDDVKDGIRRLVSVGYIVRKMVLQSVDGDVETHRVTDWQPFEVSLVAVPADPSVGVGRSAAVNTAPTPEKPAPQPSPQLSRSMAETPTPTAEKPVVTNVVDLAAERSRIKDINAAAKQLAERHPQHAEAFRNLAQTCSEQGLAIADFNRSVLNDILATQQTLAPVRQDPKAATVGLKSKDLRRYSVLKAIRSIIDGKPIEGLERECNDELIRKLGRQPAGFFLPDEVTFDSRAQARNARALEVNGSSGEGYLVGQEILSSEFETLLRNQARVVELGARYISGLTGDVSIPRQLTGASAYWVSETGTITASQATFGQIVSKPRRIGTSVPYSKQFLAQTSLGAESFVVNDSDEATATELDRVAINGAGGAEPLGILNLATADISSTVAFGAAPTWAKYLEFMKVLADSKALLGNPAYLTSVASAVKAMTIAKFANTGDPIWKDDMVGTFRARWTQQLPSGDKVIFGDFSQIIYLEWAGRDVVVDPYSGKKEGTVEVTIQRLMDMIIRRAKSFTRSTDSGAQ